MHVTILLPAFNAARFLPAALESVLAQTYGDYTVLVLDDGSTDATPAIARTFADRDARVRVVEAPHRGLCAVLNDGLARAKTPWVAIMHADDIMLPHRLERQIAFLRDHPELDVVSSFVYHIDEVGRRRGAGTSTLTSRERIDAIVQGEGAFSFHHSAVMMRRGAALAAGGYREAYWPCEDMDLWNRMAEQGYGIAVQPEYLMHYRIHSQAASVAHHRLQYEKQLFVLASIRARRRGEREPTWEAFVTERATRPAHHRIADARRVWGALLYKQAVGRYAGARYLAAAIGLLAAAALTPVDTLSKVRHRFGHFLLRSRFAALGGSKQ